MHEFLWVSQKCSRYGCPVESPMTIATVLSLALSDLICCGIVRSTYAGCNHHIAFRCGAKGNYNFGFFCLAFYPSLLTDLFLVVSRNLKGQYNQLFASPRRPKNMCFFVFLFSVFAYSWKPSYNKLFESGAMVGPERRTDYNSPISVKSSMGTLNRLMKLAFWTSSLTYIDSCRNPAEVGIKQILSMWNVVGGGDGWNVRLAPSRGLGTSRKNDKYEAKVHKKKSISPILGLGPFLLHVRLF